MLNIGKLGASGADYYVDSVAADEHDYYTGSGEAPGYWVGGAAADLGLSGVVDAADLARLLAAVDPSSGEALRSGRGGPTVPGFDLTFRAPKSVSLLWGLADPDLARQVRDAHDAAVAQALGYLQTQCSWSRRGAGGVQRVRARGLVAAAFRHRSSRAGDPLLHTHVVVANTVQTIDDGRWRTLDAARLYTNAKTGGYLYQAALRDELTRRLGVAWGPVVNGAADLDGVDRTLIEAFSQRRTEILDLLAERGETSPRAAQAATLHTRRAKPSGVDYACLHRRWRERAAALGWTSDHAAQLLGRQAVTLPDADRQQAVLAELGSPAGLTARASTFTRRDVIQAWAQRLPTGASVGDVLALADTALAADVGVAIPLASSGRQPTGHPDLPAVLDAAGEATARAGHDPADVAAVQSCDALRRAVEAALDAGVDDLEARLPAGELDSAEDPAAVLTWRAQRLLATAPVPAGQAGRWEARSTIRVATRGDSGPAVRAVIADPDERRYATPELLAVEQRLIGQATRRATGRVAVVDERLVEAAIAARPSLAEEQAVMVRRLCRAGEGVAVVVGKAGSGKTHALAAAHHAWHTARIPVVGCALAKRAADELAAGSGIESLTIDRLLADLDRPGPGAGLAAGSVLVVDEAAMVGTRKLARLFDHADAADAKIVLVGDHHQLPEVDAGGVFRGLTNRLHTIELTGNRRQRQPWQRQLADQLRHGDAGDAVAALAAHDRLVTADDADQLRERMVADWWHTTSTERPESDAGGVMVAATNAEVDDLNRRARRRMRHAGRLGHAEVDAAGRAFAAGDRVVGLRNDRRLGMTNGARGRVVAVDPAGGTVTVALDGGGGRVRLPAIYLHAGHLAHGYAITAHKAQGMTTDRVWALGSALLYREWAYTALSRHRIDAHLYLAQPDPHAACDHHRPAAPRGPHDTLAARLRRSRGQHLAIDHPAPTPAVEPAQQIADPPTRAAAARLEARRAARDAAADRRQQAHAEVAAAHADLDRLSGPLRRRRRAAARQRLDHAQRRLAQATATARRLDGEVADLARRAGARGHTQPATTHPTDAPPAGLTAEREQRPDQPADDHEVAAIAM